MDHPGHPLDPSMVSGTATARDRGQHPACRPYHTSALAHTPWSTKNMITSLLGGRHMM
jgi:hypothetical protein